MSQHGIPSAEELWERHEGLVLELFRLALQMLHKEIALPVDEDEISSILYLKTREANFHLNGLHRGLDHPPIPDAKVPPRSRDEVGTPPTKKRPDFQCGYRDMLALDQEQAYVNYCIECKRLGQTTEAGWNLNKNYVSDGIVRFVDPQHSYGKGTRSGAMVGYVQNMEPSAIASEVNRWIHDIETRSLPSIQPPHDVFDAKGLLEMSHELARPDVLPTPFRLTHLWVDLRRSAT
jgi:hypothetical protein